MQTVVANKVTPVDITGRKLQVAVRRIVHYQHRLFHPKLLEGVRKQLGFGFTQAQLVNNRQLMFQEFRRQSGTQRTPEHLFGNRIGVIAGLGTMCNRSMTPQRTPDTAGASPSCALLSPGLLASAANLIAALCGMRASTLAGQILLDCFPKQALVRCDSENLIGKLKLLDCRPIQVSDFDCRHIRYHWLVVGSYYWHRLLTLPAFALLPSARCLLLTADCLPSLMRRLG